MREHKYTTQEEIDLLKEEIKAAKLKNKNTRFTTHNVVSFSAFLIVLSVLCYVLISIIVSKQSGETPQIFGYQMYRVNSGSMSPTLNVGAVILSKIPKDKTKLKVGDIVTFQRDSVIITHRIIEVIENNNIKYRTKGDNPDNSPDIELLSSEDVKAVFIFKLY